MYNESIKTAYIDNIKEAGNIKDVSVDQIKAFFNIAQEFEETYSKDIATFSTKEIFDLYKYIGTPSVVYLQTMNSTYLKYTQWWQKNKMLTGNQNHFREIGVEELEQCVSQSMFDAKFITREELIKFINGKQDLDECEKFLLFALFEGICGNEYKEIRSIRMSDFKGNRVYLPNGREFDVSKELIDYAYNASRQTTYMTSDDKVRQLDNSDREQCFKFPPKTKGDPDKEYFYIVRKLRKIKNFDKDGRMFVGSKELKESGRIDLIKRLVKENNMEASEVIKRIPEVQMRYGAVISVDRYCRRHEKMLKG